MHDCFSFSAIVDLAFIGNGARAVQVTNEHYTPGNNILLPGRGQNMGDGWQTKRSRVPGHSDHVVIRLGDKGHILKAEIDTSHFKGNFPDSICLEATNSDSEVPAANAQWITLLPNNTKVGPHGVFHFDVPHTDKVFSHARISIIPGKCILFKCIYMSIVLTNWLCYRWWFQASSSLWCSSRWSNPCSSSCTSHYSQA